MIIGREKDTMVSDYVINTQSDTIIHSKTQTRHTRKSAKQESS